MIERPHIETITTKGGEQRIKLISPYSPKVSPLARALGGTWSAEKRAWYFDVRDASRVREMCVKIYGIDPLADEPTEFVTVRVRMSNGNVDGTIDGGSSDCWMFGREIAHRPGRDAPVRLGRDVVIIEGHFPGSGGSRNNPRMLNRSDDGVVVLEVRDVPKASAEKALSDAVQIVDAAAPDLAKDAMASILRLAAHLSDEQRRQAAAAILESISEK